MKLRDYQQELINKIKLSTDLRNCIQAPTGSGKTAIFSYLANNTDGKVLIIVNRKELVHQTARNIKRECSFITADVKKIVAKDVTIAMVETLARRKIDYSQFSLVIIDEVHNLQYTKIADKIKCRLLSFTATPVIMKREKFSRCPICSKETELKECCNNDTVEFSRNISLKRWYGELITSIKVSELIDLGYLTDIQEYICDNPNLVKLKTDSSGNFTKKSEDEVYNNFVSTENLYVNYVRHCEGKKTMIFNANIEANDSVVEYLKEKGYNIKGYHSESKGNRQDVVDWFKYSKDGILASVGVFTTGFDVEDVECIILNKSTQSLSLYHQIVGRGGRITSKIFKPFFKLVDLGGNVVRFGSWSSDVNWQKIYNNEVEKKKSDLESFVICKNCDSLINNYPCEVCGHELPISDEEKEKKEIIKEAEAIKKLRPPTATMILRYAEANQLDINGAKNLTADYLLMMLRHSNVKITNHIQLKQRINKVIVPIYFALHKSKLEGNRIRTITDFENKCYKVCLKANH